MKILLAVDDSRFAAEAIRTLVAQMRTKGTEILVLHVIEEMHAYLSAEGRTIVGAAPPKPWVVPERRVETPWVSVPGLLTGQCKTNENATYLEITVHGDPSGPRVDDIAGDLGVGAQIQVNWGLHLVDANLAMGNFIDIVGQQTKAWLDADAKAKD